MEILNQLKLDQDGLIPAIIQDDENKEVLMVGYMNREAVRRTLESGVCLLLEPLPPGILDQGGDFRTHANRANGRL